jgi:hypothetical protein
MNTAIESLGHLAAQVELEAQNPMLHPAEKQRLLDLARGYWEAQEEMLLDDPRHDSLDGHCYPDCPCLDAA